jgi:RNA recognition motif-containing protein
MTKLFVGNLPFSVTSEQLSKKFEKYGTGLVVGHPRSKGFGIVTCSGSVDAAIAEFNGTDWNGRSIIVRRDKDKAGITEKGGRGLFVSPIPEDFQLDEFKALLQQAGSVDDIFIPSYNNKPKNFALVTMSSEADAEHAIEVLNNVEFQGAQLTVHYDKKFRDDARTNPKEHKAYAREGERAKPRVTAASNNISLFVGNLAYSTSWQSLKDLFSQYGPVVRANINLDYDGKPKGNGIVIMASLEDAEKAIDNLNEYTLDGRAIRVKMDGKIITGPRIRVSNV